jgi:hypothetical protein
MNELGSTAKTLVTAARDEAGLTPEERARLRARVLATASAGGASLLASLLTKVAAAKPLGMSVVTWGALAATVAGAGTVYTLTRPPPATPAIGHPGQSDAERHERPTAQRPAQSAAEHPSHSAAERPERPTDERPGQPAVVRPERPTDERPGQPAVALLDRPAAERLVARGSDGTAARTGSEELRRRPERSLETKPRASAPASAPTSAQGADPGFAEDARLLRDVRAALAAGQSDRALSLLEAREANAASGVFAEEREAAKIVTLCELGRPEARVAAARFLKAHATSPLAERVRRACPR